MNKRIPRKLKKKQSCEDAPFAYCPPRHLAPLDACSLCSKTGNHKHAFKMRIRNNIKRVSYKAWGILHYKFSPTPFITNENWISNVMGEGEKEN